MVDAVISPVVFELGTQGTTHAPTGGQASVFDVAQFNASMNPANSPNQTKSAQVNATQNSNAVTPTQNVETQSSGFDSAVKMLKMLNGSSDLIGSDALKAASPHKELTPGEMLQITVKTHEFLFQSEMTANVANRTSDGIQQLFKQQS